MPETVKCPDCDRTLRVPDDLLGKFVRCPSCKATFTATLGTAAPPGEPQMLEEEHVSPRGASRRDDALEDRPPAPDDGDGDDDEMEETAAGRGRLHSGTREEWRRVKRGLACLLAAVS